MKVINVTKAKGGVGGTTLVIKIAEELAKLKKKTLIVENTYFFLDLMKYLDMESEVDLNKSIDEISSLIKTGLFEPEEIKENIHSYNKHIDIVVGTRNKDNRLVGNSVNELRNKVEGYDYIIFDNQKLILKDFFLFDHNFIVGEINPHNKSYFKEKFEDENFSEEDQLRFVNRTSLVINKVFDEEDIKLYGKKRVQNEFSNVFEVPHTKVSSGKVDVSRIVSFLEGEQPQKKSMFGFLKRRN
ncbi:MAG: AAA family ATPase [Tissierellales bacterium]|jgi:hypothetical protein|nr:AAA family ATPase [Tissierellales bacterium]